MIASRRQFARRAASRAARSSRYKDKSPETETRPDRAGRLRRAQALPPDAWEGLPRYVQSCAANAHRKRPYFLWVWDPANPNKKTRIPYYCNSWRCPYCQYHESHVLFTRVQEAFELFDPKDVVFLVLTLDPREHRRGKTQLGEVYREFTERAEKYVKRLRRWMARLGLAPFENEWVSTIEAHKSGIPHINFMIHSPDLAALLRADFDARRAVGEGSKEAALLRGEMLRHAVECGFGWRSTAEALRLGPNERGGIAKLAGYITKLAGKAHATHGELAKLSQVPLMAPKNFRRLRSGRRFLPARRGSDMTGALVRRYRAREGDEVAEAVTRSRNEEYMEQVRACVQREQELAWEDEDGRALRRTYALFGLSPPTQPAVRAFLLKPEGTRISAQLIVLPPSPANSDVVPSLAATRDFDPTPGATQRSQQTQTHFAWDHAAEA